MNSANAFGFLSLGTVMWLLPIVAPQWFPAHAVDGSSTREIWVQVMGATQTLLGFAFLIRPALDAARRAADLLTERVARGAAVVANWESDAQRAGVMAIDLIAGMSTRALATAERKSLEDERLEPLVWLVPGTDAAGTDGLWRPLWNDVHGRGAVRSDVTRRVATVGFRQPTQTSFARFESMDLASRD